MIRWIAAYGPALLWAAVLLFLGSREHVPVPATSLPLDKVAHFVAYGVLGALAGFGWHRAGRRPGAVVLVFLALLVGACDELNQRRLAARSAELADWAADAAGVVAGFALVRLRFRHASTTGIRK